MLQEPPDYPFVQLKIKMLQKPSDSPHKCIMVLEARMLQESPDYPLNAIGNKDAAETFRYPLAKYD
jgi:hypothetical protein